MTGAILSRNRNRKGVVWNKTDALDALGLNDRDIDRFADMGMPVASRSGASGSKWKMHSAFVFRWLLDESYRQGCLSLGQTSDEDGNSADALRIRKLKAETQLSEHKLAELSGRLVSVEDLIDILSPLVMASRPYIQDLAESLKARVDIDLHEEIDESAERCLNQIQLLIEPDSYRRDVELSDADPVADPKGESSKTENTFDR